MTEKKVETNGPIFGRNAVKQNEQVPRMDGRSKRLAAGYGIIFILGAILENEFGMFGTAVALAAYMLLTAIAVLNDAGWSNKSQVHPAPRRSS